MRLVVDANVVVSALAKDGAVRAAIRTSTDAVFMPWYLSVEINEHRSEIRTKSGLSEQAFDTLLEELFQHIEIIPRETIVPHLHEQSVDFESMTWMIQCTPLAR